MADQQSRGGKKTGAPGQPDQQQGAHGGGTDHRRSETHKKQDADAGRAGRQPHDNNDDPSRAPEPGTRE